MTPRAATACILALAACTAPGQHHGDEDRDEFEGYPAKAALGPVRVEGRYYVDQARIFGGDLVATYGLVPVALRLGVAANNGYTTEVSAIPDDMDLVLLLADGTPLPRLAPEHPAVRRRRFERLVQEALHAGLLPHFESAREGFVYFALPPDVAIESGSLSVRRMVPGGERRLDLLDSVVVFRLPVEGAWLELHVGLELARSTPSRIEAPPAPEAP